MRYDLTAMARRQNPGRRKPIVLRDIPPPAMLAQSLFARAYRPVLDRWNARIPAIMAEYARTLSAMTQDGIGFDTGKTGKEIGQKAQFSAGLREDSIQEEISPSTTLLDSPADLQAQLDAASSEMERLFILLDAAVRDWALRTEAWSREAWRGAVLSATGVDIGVMIGPADVRETLESYVAWNVRLIRDVSNEAARRISNTVFAGLQNRTPAREVAKQIQEAMGMSRRRALGIASDQLSKVTSALADERRREAGLSVWKWRHSGKKHPRSWHVARNGNLYSDDPAMVGREVDGKTVETPPAADDLPGRPPWCGCRSQGVLIFD